MAVARTFATTGPRGLREDHPMLRLYHKAKRRFWDPADLSFAEDARQWVSFSDEQRRILLQLTSLFQAGEEAVTHDLTPFIMTMSREGRTEEEIYLTSFLFEEAKHVEFFRRFLDRVGVHEDLSGYHTPSYQTVFYDALPKALDRLLADPSPEAQADAAVTYNLIVEGVLAETGYHAYFSMLEKQNLLPDLRAGLTRVQQDEARHIRFGVFLLQRLVAENDRLWERINHRMEELLVPAIGVVNDIFEPYPPGQAPFGLEPDAFVSYATHQFSRRMDAIERSRGKAMEEILAVQRDDVETIEG